MLQVFLRRIFILLLGICPGILAAQHYCIAGRFSETPLFAASEIQVDTGVIYGYSFNPFSGRSEALKMDIYYPDMKKDTMRSRPVILTMHGGGFAGGLRQNNSFFAREFARRGYVAATIDYRVGWNCTGNDYCLDCAGDSASLRQAAYMAAQDLRAAQRFLCGNASGMHINPDVFFLAGTSAGAMAVFLSVLYNQEQSEAFAPGAEALLGLIDTTGNAFPASYTVRGIASFCGAIPGDASVLARLNTPVISFHDENDCLVPYSAGTIFGCSCSSFFPCLGPQVTYNYQVMHGQCTSLNTVPGSPWHCSYPDNDVMLASTCFFKSILCNNCAADTAMGSPLAASCDSLESAFEIGTDKITVRIQPSPSNESIMLVFSDYAHSGGTIRCINILGQPMFSSHFAELATQHELDLRQLPSGLYWLFFDSPGNISPIKILVCHP